MQRTKSPPFRFRLPSLKSIGQFLKKILWESDIVGGKQHWMAYVLLLAAVGAFFLEMAVHHHGIEAFSILKAKAVTVFMVSLRLISEQSPHAA